MHFKILLKAFILFDELSIWYHTYGSRSILIEALIRHVTPWCLKVKYNRSAFRETFLSSSGDWINSSIKDILPNSYIRISQCYHFWKQNASLVYWSSFFKWKMLNSKDTLIMNLEDKCSALSSLFTMLFTFLPGRILLQSAYLYPPK